MFVLFAFYFLVFDIIFLFFGVQCHFFTFRCSVSFFYFSVFGVIFILFGVRCLVYTELFLFFGLQCTLKILYLYYFISLIIFNFLQISQTKKAKVESDLEALKEQIKRDMPLINTWRSKLLFTKEQFLDDLIAQWRKLPLVFFFNFLINMNRMKNNGEDGMKQSVPILCHQNKLKHFW